MHFLAITNLTLICYPCCYAKQSPHLVTHLPSSFQTKGSPLGAMWYTYFLVSTMFEKQRGGVKSFRTCVFNQSMFELLIVLWLKLFKLLS